MCLLATSSCPKGGIKVRRAPSCGSVAVCGVLGFTLEAVVVGDSPVNLEILGPHVVEGALAKLAAFVQGGRLPVRLRGGNNRAGGARVV